MPDTARRLYLLAATIFVWIALALQLYLSIEQSLANGMSGPEAIIRFASFFTVTTNLFIAVLLTLALLRFPAHSPRPSVMAAGAVYIVIVGIIYFALLRKTWNPQGAQLFADRALHYVMPATMLLYWLGFVPKSHLRWADALWWLIYPAVYLAFTLLEGARIGWYPYPFVDVNALGYGQVALNSAGLFAFFLGVGWIFVALDRALGRSRRSYAA